MGSPPEDRIANIESLLAELYAERFSADELESLVGEAQDARDGKQLRIDKGAARVPPGELLDRKRVLALALDLRSFSEVHRPRRAPLGP